MEAEAFKPRSHYYVNPRVDLEPFLPEKISRVLDVGCAQGLFGKVLRERWGAEVTGVEFRVEVAEIARENLNEVHVGDAAVVLPTLPKGHFDLIMFNDVLEHMVDPEKVLRSAIPLLAPDGMVLVSLPNLRFWTSFRHLAWNGVFEYEDFGVMDRTHLRFYTQKSIPGFFERSGFRIERMEGIHPTTSRTLKLANLLTFNRFKDCKYIQYAIVAKPELTGRGG
jgi:2-polyprenyl-3-methyl-5-hydroxy-6-metoxy-1,4-benzoquinol methylase